jgi:hypothetical protein
MASGLAITTSKFISPDFTVAARSSIPDDFRTCFASRISSGALGKYRNPYRFSGSIG